MLMHSREGISRIETLAMAFNARDQVTRGHTRRVQVIAARLATALGVRDKHLLQAIETAAVLHDVGKLAVPECILNKPGALSPAEFEAIKLHASIGAEILSATQFPDPVVSIVRHHHENWDGTGYPAGLAGTDIPVGARILAVADCFDALTSDRPYRPRLRSAEALEELQARCGAKYDPSIVDVFVNRCGEIMPGADRLLQQRVFSAPARLTTSILLVRIDSARHDQVRRLPSLEGIASQVLTAMRLRLRASDLAFAWSPCELVVLLPGADLRTASEIADRVLADMNAAEFAYRVRYSTASAPSDGESLHALLDMARQRLSGHRHAESVAFAS